ncbi:MAG: hypothetical protein JO362_14470 [Streptomycetaceae bacterium]|nr:hypothetical protein [Streptomycetaceae bacterium]
MHIFGFFGRFRGRHSDGGWGWGGDGGWDGGYWGGGDWGGDWGRGGCW